MIADSRQNFRSIKVDDLALIGLAGVDVYNSNAAVKERFYGLHMHFRIRADRPLSIDFWQR